MTAARLEELARRCDEALADQDHGFGPYFDAQDIADLARCARAWEKVAKTGEGWVWAWDDCGDRALLSAMSNGKDSPIEAVEAAEVTDANKG